MSENTLENQSDVKPVRLEEALKRLGEIVKTLESNESSLEDSLKIFEEGVQLSQFCHEKLSSAEKKIEILTSVNTKGVETQPLK